MHFVRVLVICLVCLQSFTPAFPQQSNSGHVLNGKCYEAKNDENTLGISRLDVFFSESGGLRGAFLHNSYPGRTFFFRLGECEGDQTAVICVNGPLCNIPIRELFQFKQRHDGSLLGFADGIDATTLQRSNVLRDNETETVDGPFVFREVLEEKVCVPEDNGVQSTLFAGSVGDSVLELEIKLQELGYFFGNPDVVFNVQTEEALKLFQADKEVASTGVLDDFTRNLVDYSLFSNGGGC